VSPHVTKFDLATLAAALAALLDALPRIEGVIVGALAIVWWIYRIKRERQAGRADPPRVE
jgi:hypothetical protein